MTTAMETGGEQGRFTASVSTDGTAIASPHSSLCASYWTADHIAAIVKNDGTTLSAAPLITGQDFAAVDKDLCIWDAWPLQNEDGSTTIFADGSILWFALAAPWFDDPEERHGHARIHLFLKQPTGWISIGPAMPDGFSPGSREWSGSAILDPAATTLTLYFTAAGQRGEKELTFNQRLFQAKADIAVIDGIPHLDNWRNLRESVPRDDALYMDPLSSGGGIGTIKAFRDPGFFRDPATGQAWLFFTGSIATTASAFNGAIGAATATDEGLTAWQIIPPVINADGLNNELERPHIIHHDGLYYLFWSTQAHIFDPAGPTGPTGLYGMVSDNLLTGWQPLNGSGLVIANPPEAPRQAYSWLVLSDLSVTSFVDDWGRGPDQDGNKHFGGTFAPFVYLNLNGAQADMKVTP